MSVLQVGMSPIPSVYPCVYPTTDFFVGLRHPVYRQECHQGHWPKKTDDSDKELSCPKQYCQDNG